MTLSLTVCSVFLTLASQAADDRPTAAASSARALDTAAGVEHACARLDDGTLWCWGKNRDGRLGDGTTTDRKEPVQVRGIKNAIGVSAGTEHTCAALDDGHVRCWGENGSGQLGDGTTTDRSEPVEVPGIVDVAQVAAGHNASCALHADGTISCWGYNGFGQLGDGTKKDHRKPEPVAGINNAVEIGMGGGHTCARLKGGAVRCWGRNDWGQLGVGQQGKAHLRLKPVPIPVDDAVQLSLGFGQTCVVVAKGAVMCWGGNDYGQLGVGNTSNQTSPKRVKNILRATHVAAGAQHSCALIGKDLRCWGGNAQGQLKSNVRLLKEAPDDSLLTSIKHVSVGNGFTCAVSDEGKVSCFGDDRFGQCGGNDLGR